MPVQSGELWYFAYGSNMSAEKFTGRRGIVPLASARVRLPGWILSMEIPGVPYSDPSYGSIRPRDDSEAEKNVQPDVVGVAYRITAEQHRQVIASEGGQIAYTDIAVSGNPINPEDESKTGPEVTVRTLGSTTMIRNPPPRPSKRYMHLLKTGAKAAELPAAYQQYLIDMPCYVPPTNKWTKFGAFLFLQLMNPVWSLLDKITHSNTGKDGNVPAHIVWLVRSVIFIIWLIHDWVFAPIFGRGDGLDQVEPELIMAESNQALIPCEKSGSIYNTM